MNTASGVTTQGTHVWDNLIHDPGVSIAADKETIANGQNVIRGALMGRITAGGEWVLSLSGAGDGSEVPRAIMVDDVDASGAAAEGMLYTKGSFNELALTFGAGHTADSVRDGLRDIGIYLGKNTQT